MRLLLSILTIDRQTVLNLNKMRFNIDVIIITMCVHLYRACDRKALQMK